MRDPRFPLPCGGYRGRGHHTPRHANHTAMRHGYDPLVLQYDPLVLQYGPLVLQYNLLVLQYGLLVLQYDPLVLQYGLLVLQYGQLVLQYGLFVLQYDSLVLHMLASSCNNCEQYRQRWMFNTSEWSPSPNELSKLLRLLPASEAADVQRFVRPVDQHRALISRLMQRSCISKLFGVPLTEVRISRTKGRKPFADPGLNKGEAVNFNFNVSHEGDYVVLASEPICLVGIDVAAPQQLRRPGSSTSLAAALESMQGQLSPVEGQWSPLTWELVMSFEKDEAKMEACFQRLWSLKEGQSLQSAVPLLPNAFIKARDDGVGFEG
eukprot:gene7540-689_t